jgi:hypothetical protein
MADVKALRDAIVEALPGQTSNFGETPDVKHLYVPPAHIKALRPECHLVIGTRGVGKSVWTAALGSSKLRKALGSSVPELDRAEVAIGFAESQCIDSYPDAATFAQLLHFGHTAHSVWQAVVVRWLVAGQVPRESWRDTVAWVDTHPESLARLIQDASQRLADDRRTGLIVFDALDRLSQDWQTMDRIVRDLLRVALWLKSYPRLSAKVFLREDQFERTVTDFPDASKLLATRADLSWAPHDLHGLLWQYLLNGSDDHGQRLREIYRETTGSEATEFDGGWSLTDAVKRETPTQRSLFEALAGPWMGRDKRRGVPYVWAVGHLADGKGRTSPRSFLAAIRQAAEDSGERYPDYPLALHYESLKRGIQKASEIRVAELAEDYPWVRAFMETLEGLNVPCDYTTIVEKWVESYPAGPSSAAMDRLPPQHATRGWDGIRDDLIRLGIFDVRRDNRIDMPDLYRVGFKLGRKGGVKPRS